MKKLGELLFLRILVHFIDYSCSFWLDFLNSGKVSFPIGKHYFLQSGKRVQQTRQMQIRNKYYYSENVKPFYVFCRIILEFWLYLHGLLNAFPTLQNDMVSNQETSFSQSGNALSKPCKSKWKCVRNLLFLRIIVHFH